MLFNKPTELKTAVIAGASGLVGKQLMYKLLENKTYAKVTVLVRTPMQIKHPKLLQLEVDFDKLSSYRDQMQGDDFFCCLGTTIKQAGSKEAFYKVDFTYCYEFAKIAVENKAKRFLLISAIGSSSKSAIFYSKVKGQLEDAIQSMPIPNIHIFQPSFLIGTRLQPRLGERFGIAFAQLISPFMVGKLKKYKPIAATEVARAMLHAAQTVSSIKTHRYTYVEMQELQAQ